MRIFNKEQNQIVAYIQQKNLKAIIKFEDRVPKSLLKLAKSMNLSDMDETHDEEFIRLTDKKEIKFLANMYWIPEYKDLRGLTDEQLTAKVEERAAKISEMHSLYMGMGPYEQRNNYHFPVEYSKINQTIKDINAYLWTRQGKYDTPVSIPLEIDGFNTIIESDGNLRIGLNLEGDKILVQRKDGKKFEGGIGIHPFELQSGLLIFFAESGLQPKVPGEVNLSIRPEPSHRFLIADYEFEPAKDYVPPVEEQAPTRLRAPEKKKSLFQRVFKQKDEN